jgi:hypothetical protein
MKEILTKAGGDEALGNFDTTNQEMEWLSDDFYQLECLERTHEDLDYER